MVKILVPTQLRSHCGGAAELALSASTVRLALAELERSQPTLYRSLCDETGAVRRDVNLFVNEFHLRDQEELETILTSGDILTILPESSE
jgi:sulfur-carrier protein